jgi:hypothetical protein
MAMVVRRLMVFAALSFAVAGIRARAALTVGLVISALAMLVAPVLSLGALLAPTVVAARYRTRGYTPGAPHVRQRRNHNRVRNEGSPASRSACEHGVSLVTDLSRVAHLRYHPGRAGAC